MKHTVWLLLVALVALAAWWWLPSAAPAPQPQPEVQAPRFEAPLARREAIGTLPVDVPTLAPQALSKGVAPEIAAKNRAALTALEAQQYDEAVQLLDECLVAAPGQAVLRHNLAEALWRRAHARDLGVVAQLELSIADLTRAIELAPERTEIPPRRDEWRRRLDAQRDMWTDHSAHFALSYDGSRSDLLASYSSLLALLEDAYGEYVTLFGIAPVESEGRPISVVLYRKQDFRDATGIGHWAGGLYDGVVRVPVEDLSKERQALRRVLRHELAHAFVARVAANRAPGWLNEGLAMRLEDDDAAWRARVKDSGQRLRSLPRITVAELGGSLAAIVGEDRVRAAYAVALVLLDEVVLAAGERAPYELLEAAAAGDLPAKLQRLTGVELEVLLERVQTR
jgi:tetratricopeptide (TPR) repeat protein